MICVTWLVQGNRRWGIRWCSVHRRSRLTNYINLENIFRATSSLYSVLDLLVHCPWVASLCGIDSHATHPWSSLGIRAALNIFFLGNYKCPTSHYNVWGPVHSSQIYLALLPKSRPTTWHRFRLAHSYEMAQINLHVIYGDNVPPAAFRCSNRCVNFMQNTSFAFSSSYFIRNTCLAFVFHVHCFVMSCCRVSRFSYLVRKRRIILFDFNQKPSSSQKFILLLEVSEFRLLFWTSNETLFFFAEYLHAQCFHQIFEAFYLPFCL